MAITQAMCTSFKQALLDGEMDFSSNTAQTFKIALYTSSASLDAATAAYTTSISTNPTNGGSGTTVFLSFANTTWTSSTITARGALVYQSGGGNPSVAVLDFGADKSSSNGDFQIQFPTADATSAIIRIA